MSFQQPANGTTRPPTEGVAGQVAASVLDTVKHAAANAPRSLQTELGPSELGTPCIRRMAYKILDAIRPLDHPNADTDPWASTVGTAIHAWLADVYAAENAKLTGTPAHDRYLIEHKVTLPGDIPGNCDLFDRDHGTVIDWKTTGNEALKKYRKNGPGPQYRTQAHLYGLGMQLAGEHVSDVAIVFLPRAGRLDDLWVWSEPYDPLVAVNAIKRYQATQLALMMIDPEANPDKWPLFPTGDAYCAYCPMYLPGSRDLASGCPGHNPR